MKPPNQTVSSFFSPTLCTRFPDRPQSTETLKELTFAATGKIADQIDQDYYVELALIEHRVS